VSAVELALVAAAALVFGIAGAVKVAGEEALHYRALGVGEVGIALAALVPATRVGGLVAGTALAVGFTAYAAARDHRCRCFGERFRAMSRATRVARAGSLLVLCGAALAASLGAVPAASETKWRLTPLVVGGVIGLLVVLIPSVLSVESHDDAEEVRLNV
jgi:hypothetical protein